MDAASRRLKKIERFSFETQKKNSRHFSGQPFWKKGLEPKMVTRNKKRLFGSKQNRKSIIQNYFWLSPPPRPSVCFDIRLAKCSNQVGQSEKSKRRGNCINKKLKQQQQQRRRQQQPQQQQRRRQQQQQQQPVPFLAENWQLFALLLVSVWTGFSLFAAGLLSTRSCLHRRFFSRREAHTRLLSMFLLE